MDYSKLDNLIRLPKKGDAPREKKEEYKKNMLVLLSEEGYTSVAEKYFFGGFPFCGAFPVFDFIKNLGDADKFDFITKITKGTMYNDNEKGMSLKILIHLLSLFIVNFPQNTETIGLLMRCIPYRAKTKSGKISNDLPSIIEKYFISEISTETKYPDLPTIFNNEDMQTEFVLFFTDAIKNVNTKGERNQEILEVVLNWLNTAKPTIPEQSEDRNQQIPKAKFDVKSLLHFEEMLKNELAVISQAVEHITNLKNELSQAKTAKTDILKKFNLLEENYARLKTSNELLASEELKLRSKLNTLKEDIASHEKEIFSLREESDKQKSVISIYSSDKQNSLNEQLNDIASKLKTHYLNYKDAVEMEMNSELGENIRNLMGDIFKTLAKSGINVEGRISNG